MLCARFLAKFLTFDDKNKLSEIFRLPIKNTRRSAIKRDGTLMCQVFGVWNAKIDVTHSWRQHFCHHLTKFPKTCLKKRSIVSSLRNTFCNSVSCFHFRKKNQVRSPLLGNVFARLHKLSYCWWSLTANHQVMHFVNQWRRMFILSYCVKMVPTSTLIGWITLRIFLELVVNLDSVLPQKQSKNHLIYKKPFQYQCNCM